MDQSLSCASRELSEAGCDVPQYVQRDGTVSDGSADPRWWLGQVPAIAQLRVRSLSDVDGPVRHWVAVPDDLWSTSGYGQKRRFDLYLPDFAAYGYVRIIESREIDDHVVAAR